MNSKTISAVCHACGYEWEYNGKNPFYATCPFCRTTVKIGKKKLLPSSSPKPKKAVVGSSRSGGKPA